jgi:1-acyl-sn-glycerol-3-phosphate acyltransferase
LAIWRLLDRIWRLIGTGLSFAVFGLGGAVAGLIFFPALLLLVRNPEKRKRLGRAAINRLFNVFVHFMAAVGVLRWQLGGMHAVDPSRPSLIIANHPSLIDVVFLLAFFPGVNCVIKSSLWRNPSMGPMLRAAGYISNRTPLETLQACIEAIASGDSLILFPEGTRTRPDQPVSFTPGAAAIAVRAACPVIPVLISCEPTTLTKGEPWYHIPARRVLVRIEVGEAIDSGSFLRESRNPRDATDRFNAYLQQHFRSRMENPRDSG